MGLPRQQALQKAKVLFENERLQDFNTKDTTLALGCPSLWCQTSKVQEENEFLAIADKATEFLLQRESASRCVRLRLSKVYNPSLTFPPKRVFLDT